jgi:hypothetical protein
VLLAASPPRSALFDLVLLLHIGVALVSLVVMTTAWGAARSLAASPPGGPWPGAAARYFRPGPEIAGRALWLVPVTGLALVGMSRGAYELSDPFVLVGIVLWIVIAAAAEHLVFSSSASLARLIAAGPVPEEPAWRRPLRRVRQGAELAAVGLVAAALLMLVQP